MTITTKPSTAEYRDGHERIFGNGPAPVHPAPPADRIAELRGQLAAIKLNQAPGWRGKWCELRAELAELGRS